MALLTHACAKTVDSEANCKQPASQGLSQACCLQRGIDACGAMLFCAAFDGRATATCYSEYSRADGEECFENRHCKSKFCNLDTRKCSAGGTTTASSSSSAGAGGGGGAGGASSGCGPTPKACDDACQVAWCCGKDGLCPGFTPANEGSAKNACKTACAQLGSGFVDFVDPSNCPKTINSLNSLSSSFKKSCNGS
jgi:hypothetical protein